MGNERRQEVNNQKPAVSDVYIPLHTPNLFGFPPFFFLSFSFSFSFSFLFSFFSPPPLSSDSYQTERGIFSLGSQWTALVPLVYTRPETKMQIGTGPRTSSQPPGFGTADQCHRNLFPFPGFQTAGSSRDTRDMRWCIIAISSKGL